MQLLRDLLKSHLMPAERVMLAVTAAIAAMALLLLACRGYAVEWRAYVPILGGGLGMLALGLFYRRTGRGGAIASTLIATGLYINFAAVAAAFNYTLLPLWRAPIDPTLAAIDGLVGFHWPDALALAAGYPLLVEATRYAYMSSLVQFALIVLLLGLGGRTRELQVFMLATTLACLATVGFWALFPSFGTSTIYELGPELMRQLRPVVGNGYGAELLRLGAEGPALISPKDTLGLIAAPSFHTVMALLAVHAAWTLAWVRWPLVAVNVLVLPGTIIHGGHHLVDVLAGAAVTVAGIAMARSLIERSACPSAREAPASAR